MFREIVQYFLLNLLNCNIIDIFILRFLLANTVLFGIIYYEKVPGFVIQVKRRKLIENES